MATLSLRAYARHRRAAGIVGGTLQAVQKAIKRGWIQVEPDGRIEPREADRRWAQLHSPRVYPTHTTTATPPRPLDDQELPPVITAYLQLLERVNDVYDRSFRVGLAEARYDLKKEDAETSRRKCWRSLWKAWDALKAELPVFQQELFAVAILAEQFGDGRSERRRGALADGQS